MTGGVAMPLGWAWTIGSRIPALDLFTLTQKRT